MGGNSILGGYINCGHNDHFRILHRCRRISSSSRTGEVVNEGTDLDLAHSPLPRYDLISNTMLWFVRETKNSYTDCSSARPMVGLLFAHFILCKYHNLISTENEMYGVEKINKYGTFHFLGKENLTMSNHHVIAKFLGVECFSPMFSGKQTAYEIQAIHSTLGIFLLVLGPHIGFIFQ